MSTVDTQRYAPQYKYEMQPPPPHDNSSNPTGVHVNPRNAPTESTPPRPQVGPEQRGQFSSHNKIVNQPTQGADSKDEIAALTEKNNQLIAKHKSLREKVGKKLNDLYAQIDKLLQEIKKSGKKPEQAPATPDAPPTNRRADGQSAPPQTSSTPGTQGTQGTQNTQGSQDTQGTQGTQGSQNTQGTQGSQDTQGTQGTQDTQGTQGSQNTPGTQGSQDTQSTPGTQGSQDTQSTQGAEQSQPQGLDNVAKQQTDIQNLFSNLLKEFQSAMKLVSDKLDELSAAYSKGAPQKQTAPESSGTPEAGSSDPVKPDTAASPQNEESAPANDSKAPAPANDSTAPAPGTVAYLNQKNQELEKQIAEMEQNFEQETSKLTAQVNTLTKQISGQNQ